MNFPRPRAGPNGKLVPSVGPVSETSKGSQAGFETEKGRTVTGMCRCRGGVKSNYFRELGLRKLSIRTANII